MRYKFFSPAYLVLAVSMLGCAGAQVTQQSSAAPVINSRPIAGLRLSLRCKCV